MAGPFDRSEYAQTAGAEISSGPNWFQSGNDLAALAGPPVATKGDSAGPATISAAGDSGEITHAIKNGVHNFDYSALLQGKERVAFFGERHDDLSQKDEIIAHLRSLRDNNGLTHVALEMLNDADMPDVKSYFAGTGSRQAVLERLKKRWNIAPGVPEKYMLMIDAVKDARLQPLALDQVGSGKDDSRGTLFHDRNQHWAEVVNDTLLANINAKVLVYSGRDHVGYSRGQDRANEILKSDFGRSSTVVLFNSRFDAPQTLSGKVAKAAQIAGLSKNQFALQLDPTSLERPADIVLHQPD